MTIVNKVPSTIVPSLNLELRELRNEIAQLKAEKEITERQSQETTTHLASLEERRQRLVSEIETYKQELSDLVALSGEAVMDCLAQIRKAHQLMEDFNYTLEALDGEMFKREQELSRLERDKTAAHQQIVEETKKLDTKKRDLDIYQSRLEEYFKKYLPEQKIL